MLKKIRDIRRTLRYLRIHEALFQEPVRTPFGFVFLGREDMQDGTFEVGEVRLVQKCLALVDLFVDIGANQGYFACIAKSRGVETICVEPLADNLRYLYANLEANNWLDVPVFPLALSNRSGLLKLYGDGTGASLIGGWAGASPDLSAIVPVNSLDAILGSQLSGKQVMIKIDVEGAEHDLLLGAPGVLGMDPRPMWLVEICLDEHFPEGFNRRYEDTFALFFRQGYAAFTTGDEPVRITGEDVGRWVRNRQRDRGAGCTFLFADPRMTESIVDG